MKIRADIKCHTCGFVSGEVYGEAVAGQVGPRTSRLRPERIVASPLAPKPWPKDQTRLSCARCGGAVYLDDIDIIREKTPAAVAGLRKAA